MIPIYPFSFFDCSFPRPDACSWSIWNLSSPSSRSPFRIVINLWLDPCFSLWQSLLFHNILLSNYLFFPLLIIFSPAIYLTKLVIPGSPLHFFPGRNFTPTPAISGFKMPFFLLSSQSCSRALIRSTNHLPEVPSVCFLKPPCLYFAFFLPLHLRIINCYPSLTTLWVEFSPSFLVRIKHDPSVLPVAFPVSQWNYFALKQLLGNWNPRPLENWDPASAFAQDLSGCFKPPEKTSSRFLGVYFCGAEEQRIFYPDLSVRGVWRCKMRDHKGSHLLLHMEVFNIPALSHLLGSSPASWQH